MVEFYIFQARKDAVKWRDVFAHKSSRTCIVCRHFALSQRFCEQGKFVTQAGATCRQFSKPKHRLKSK